MASYQQRYVAAATRARKQRAGEDADPLKQDADPRSVLLQPGLSLCMACPGTQPLAKVPHYPQHKELISRITV